MTVDLFFSSLNPFPNQVIAFLIFICKISKKIFPLYLFYFLNPFSKLFSYLSVHNIIEYIKQKMVNSNDNLAQLWKTRLHNLTDLQVPTDYPRPLPARTVEQTESFDLSEKTLMGLVQVSMSPIRPTPFSVILAAFSVLLQRYTGDEEFAIGTSSPTGNPLLLRLNVDPTTTFNSVVEMVRKV